MKTQTIFIFNPYETLPSNIVSLLIGFAYRKNAIKYCKDNHIKPLRIIKATARFQDIHIIDMGRNEFLTGIKSCL